MYLLEKRPGFHTYKLYFVGGWNTTYEKLLCPEYLGIVGIQNIKFTIVHKYADGSLLVE